MLETRVHLGTHVQLFAQEELWARYASSPDSAVSYTPEGFRAPGNRTESFYRAGAAILPWKTRPHRVNACVTNKQVMASQAVSFFGVTEPRRFQPGTYWLLEFQAFL